MLTITIGGIEQYDEINNEFTTSKVHTLTLEHSLVSLSKWESFYCKPFLTKKGKSYEETVYYVRCMTLTQNVNEEAYSNIDDTIISQVNEYIDAPMTATTFSKTNKQTPNRETVTAEIIYYWMIALSIPLECQKWHLNRLLTLISVCNIKNQPPKKLNKKAILNQNAQLNAARRAQYNTKG